MSTLVRALRLKSAWWFVPIGALVGVVVAFLVTMMMPKTYTATTIIFIGSPAAGDSAGAYQGDLFSQQRATTYAQLFGSDDLAVKVNDDLGLGLPPDQLAAKVTAAPVEKTVLLQVSVVDATPTGAADIANAYADNFAQYVGPLENPTGGGQPSSILRVIRSAEPPAAPTSPSTVVNLGIGAFLGAAVAGGVVWLRRRFDTHVRTATDLAAATGAPILGTLPGDPERGARLLTLPAESSTEYAEHVRKLRTTVQFSDTSTSALSLVVSGAASSDDAREVAAHLALMLTETGRRVALVDADLRDPALAAYVGAPPGVVGLSEVLAGALMVEDALTTIAHDRVSFLAAGRGTATVGEDIASNLMRNVLAELVRTFDAVIIVTATAETYADAAVLGAEVDGAVLAVRSGSATADGVRRAAESLTSSGGAFRGAVLLAPRARSRREKSNPAVTASARAATPVKGPATPALRPESPSRITDAPADRPNVESVGRPERHDGVQEHVYRDDVYRDDVYRNDAYRNDVYRDTQPHQDRHEREPSARIRSEDDFDTDAIPAVEASPPRADSSDWAPAAPIQRRVDPRRRRRPLPHTGQGMAAAESTADGQMADRGDVPDVREGKSTTVTTSATARAVTKAASTSEVASEKSGAEKAAVAKSAAAKSGVEKSGVEKSAADESPGRSSADEDEDVPSVTTTAVTPAGLAASGRVRGRGK